MIQEMLRQLDVRAFWLATVCTLVCFPFVGLTLELMSDLWRID